MKNGTVHILATTLISYAVVSFQTDIWQAIAVGLIGVALYVGKEYLVSKGFNISGKN